MIFTVPLAAGTVLANLLWEWYVTGAPTTPASSGITQPDTDFPVFRIDTGSTVPTGAEELIVYDSTDGNNWNVGGYRINQMVALMGSAQTVLLASPYVPTTGPITIIPSSPASLSICRCYGTWKDISALSVDGEPMTLTLVAIDNVDPTLIYDLSGTPLKNTETGLIVAERVINLTLVAGALQNKNGDPFVDLNRTDYISGTPTGSNLQYLMTCDVIGASTSLTLLSSVSTVAFQPVLFKLDTSTIGLTTSGTFDLSKKAVA
jgi:hypothetical protein